MLTVGTVCLAVLAAVRGSTGVRLEGEVFEEQEASGILESSTEKAFSSASDHSTATGAEEECQLAVNGSTQKRRNRCECPEGTQVKCSGEPCNKHGRTFSLKAFAERSCFCAECDTSCEAVPGAKTRNSKWIRITGRDCECDEGLFLAGGHANCKGRGRKDQYFKSKRVVDRGCFCTTDVSEQQDSEGEERALPAHSGGASSSGQEQAAGKEVEVEVNKELEVNKEVEVNEEATTAEGDEHRVEEGPPKTAGPVEWYKKHPDIMQKVVYGSCGILVAGLFITTVYRIYKMATEDDHEHAADGSETRSPQDAGARSPSN